MRVKSYDHFNFSRASVIQFLACRHNMPSNRTSEWKVMTILISREHQLFNFEPLDMFCAWIRHASEKLWPFEFLESFCCSISSISIRYAPQSYMRVKSYDHLNFSSASVVQFLASWNSIFPNRTYESKVMTIWISHELPLFNFKRLDKLCTWIGNPSEKLWPFQFLESFRCSISSVSIWYVPESDMWVKSYDHLHFSRASVVQFLASQYGMRLNRLCDWKVMTI